MPQAMTETWNVSDMAKINIHIKDIEKYLGQEIGTSRWLEITQSRIQKFAEATGDFQWIHVDPERARTDLPAKKTIAHGYLILSMVPQLFGQIVAVSGLKYGLNYGSNRIRNISQVPVGSRIRLKVSLKDLVKRPDGTLLLTFDAMVEREGASRPVVAMELLILMAPA